MPELTGHQLSQVNKWLDKAERDLAADHPMHATLAVRRVLLDLFAWGVPNDDPLVDKAYSVLAKASAAREAKRGKSQG